MRLRRLLWALVLPPLLLVVPAEAAGVDAVASYVLTLGGINIATGDIKFDDDGQHYSIGLDAQVTGIANMVANGTAKADASGSSSGPALASEHFDLLTHANGEDFSIKAGFAHGAVTSFVVTPPVTDNTNRVPLERSQLTGVSDMLSAFVLKGPALDKSLCQQRFHIFTGLERFDIGLSYLAEDKATSLRTGYQGPVVQCRMKYTPISGHFTTSDTTNYLAKSDQLFIWYAPLGTSGYFIPYRVLVSTSVGDLSMVLIKLKD